MMLRTPWMEVTWMARPLRIDELWDLSSPESPVISPDGSRICYVLCSHDRDEDRTRRVLWSVEGDSTYRLTSGPADTAPVWCPEGRWIAFLRGSGQPQVWLLDASGRGAVEPRRLTNLDGGAGAPAWSPDGRWLAFTAPSGTGLQDGPIVSERVDYHADGGGIIGETSSDIHVLEVATGWCRAVAENIRFCGDPAWSPDSRWLAFTAGPDHDSDLTLWTDTHVVAVSLDATATERIPRRIAPDVLARGPVSWTPDGASMLVTGKRDTSVPDELFRLDVVTGAARSLTGLLNRNLLRAAPGYPGGTPQVTSDGGGVLCCVRDRGASHLYYVPLDGAPLVALLADTGTSVSGVTEAAGRVAFLLRSSTSYGEIATLDRSTKTVTLRSDYSRLRSGPDLVPVVGEEREFLSSDGSAVHGWLLRDSGKQGPRALLLDIHGGPHSAWEGCVDDTHLYQQELIARGWAILLVNPRGSDGYGSTFAAAARGAWGTADAPDLLCAVDQLVDEGIADPHRLAVAGYSYGGYMASFLTAFDTDSRRPSQAAWCAIWVVSSGPPMRDFLRRVSSWAGCHGTCRRSMSGCRHGHAWVM